MSMLGFATTVDEVIDGVDLIGKTTVVTGASSGLGLQTVATLASAGAEVVATVRDPDSFRASAEWADLGALTRRINAMPLDLARLHSVRAAAQAIASQYPRLDILINNAGVMFTPPATTADGFELQFGVNHLGHFLLTTLLLPQLRAAAAASGDARVVTLTSEAHRGWGIDLDDIDFERRGYDTFLAYGQAKSANILMTVELDRRFGAEGITALAVHPGTCATNLARYMDRATLKKLFAMSTDTFAPENMKTVAQAAATTVWAATEPSLAGHGGAYLADCRIDEADAAATDAATAQRLWQLSQQWVDSPGSMCSATEN
jgi:NAD(P)-dependent dehydrogenase (short-subunit alcohol dehydrogenase family)